MAALKPPIPPPAASPIIAILNCFDATGRNACQVAIYADGSTKSFGETTLSRRPLGFLNSASLRPLR